MNSIAENALAERLDALDRKLDRVLDEIDEVRRIRQEVAELKDDLARVGKDLFRTAVNELEGTAPFVNTGDFAALAKRLIRNVNTLNDLLVQLESAHELFADAAPLGRQLFSDGLAKMDELDRKGYFTLARELGRALDNVVTQFTPEQARRLTDNLVPLLQTANTLAQPPLLQAVNSAAAAFQQIDFATAEECSLWRAFRELNSPDMRRGLGVLIVFLRHLNARAPFARAAS